MSICPNKKSDNWNSLTSGLSEALSGKSAKDIDAIAHVAFLIKGDGSIPTVDEAIQLLSKQGKKQLNQTVKVATKAFKEGAKEARKEAFLAGQMRQGRDMAPKMRALEDQLANNKITKQEYDERIKELEYESMFKQAEVKLAAEIEGKKAGRKEGVKEQTAFQKSFSKKVGDFLKESEQLRGSLSRKQVESIIRKAAYIGSSERDLKRFTDYFEKVVANANYDSDLKVGKSLQAKLVKPFADAASIVKRMKNIPLDYLSQKELTEFNDIASLYAASRLPVTSPNYQAFDVKNAEKLFAPIEESVKQYVISDVEEAYGVLGINEEEAIAIDEFMSAEDMDAYLNSLNDAKRKALRYNLERVANYSLLGLKEKLARSVPSAYPIIEKPNSEQQLIDIQNGDIVTFRYDKESDIPSVFRDKISSVQEINGKRIINVSVAKSIADYELYRSVPAPTALAKQKILFDKLKRISDVNVALIADSKQIAELIRIVDNSVINDSNSNINNAVAIVLATENTSRLKQATSAVKRFLIGGFSKFYYDTPIILQRMFGDTVVEAAIRRLTGLDGVITASTGAERTVIEKVKEYQKFKKENGIDNSAETDITVGVFADLANVKLGEEDSDYRNNKEQLRKSIEVYKKSSDAEDNYIGQLLDGIYQSSVKDFNTLDEFKNGYSNLHPLEVKAAEWMNQNVWKVYEDDFKTHAEEDLNETFEYEGRPQYHPRRYKKVGTDAQEFDPFDTVFKSNALKPKETGRSKERRLIDNLPKNKAVEYRFEFNSFKTLQEQLFTSKSHLSAKVFQYMSQNTEAMSEIFGGQVNSDFFTESFKKQYDMMRYGRKNSDELFNSVLMSSTRILKDLGSAIALGRPTQIISQTTPLILASVRNPKYMSMVMASNVPIDLELFNLAPIGSRGIEMGAAGRAEESEVLSYGKTKRGAKKIASNIADTSAGIRSLSLSALTAADVYTAKKSFASYYLKYMNDVAKIPTTANDLKTEHTRMNEEREMALSYAQQSVDKTQAVSTRVLQSEFKKNENGSFWSEIVKNIIIPFNNFNSNTKARLIEDASKILYGNSTQKREAAIDAAGTTLETAAYQAINVFLISSIYRYGIKEVLKSAFDIEDDDDFYESLSGSFRKWYTYVLRDLTVGGFGAGVEDSGITVMNTMAYLFSEDAWSDTGRDIFSWLREEPTFQPSFKPQNTIDFGWYDALGTYGIPFKTAQKSISDISYSIKGEAPAAFFFQKSVRKENERSDLSGVSEKDVQLSDEQKRFFLFMGIANGISAISGFQDADIMRAGEKLKSNIKRGERFRQYPSKTKRGGAKGGMKMGGMGGGSMKMGR